MSSVLAHGRGRFGLVLLAASLAACGAGQTAAKPAADVAKAKAATPAKTMVSTDDAEVASLLVMASDEDQVATRKTIERRVRMGETRAKARASLPFRIEDLPVLVPSDPLLDKNAPASIKQAYAKEVVAKKQSSSSGYYGRGHGYGYGQQNDMTYNTVSVEGEGFSAGILRVGTNEATFYRRYDSNYGGVSVTCGKNEYTMAARWEGLVSKDGEKTYEVVDAWFDRKECKASVVRRTSVKLAEIVPGTVYAFRQCSDAECSGKTSVALVIPDAQSAVVQGTPLAPNASPAARIVVPVKRGGSEAVLAQVAKASSRNSSASKRVAVEIMQGTKDDAPFATAFVEDL